MGDMKDKLGIMKDKVAGGVKENVGKVINNETLELKGKIQSAKSDMKRKLSEDNVEDKVDDIKEDIAGKINDMIDKHDK